jgi:hypothetical protein
MRGYRIVLKVLEIVLSTVFLLLCVKAICSHFHNHLRLVLRYGRQQIAPMPKSPSPVIATKTTPSTPDFVA